MSLGRARALGLAALLVAAPAGAQPADPAEPVETPPASTAAQPAPEPPVPEPPALDRIAFEFRVPSERARFNLADGSGLSAIQLTARRVGPTTFATSAL